MLDQFRTQKIEWNRANNQIYDRVEANSGDSNGRILFVQILNGGMVEDLTGAVLYLAWHKGTAQGLEAFDEIDAKKGQFRLFYPTGMLENHGVLQASLVLVDVTGRIESKPFGIIVHKGAVDDEAVESDNKFTALTTALVKVSQVQAEFDGLYADKSLMMDTLHDDKKADMEALEQDYVNRANSLEATYAPRLTGVEISKAEKTSLNATDQVVKNLSDRKADISLVNNLLANVSQGGPADTLNNYSELIAKYPSGSNKPMLVKEPDGVTGYIYTWTTGTWKKGVLYQDAGLPDATKKIIDNALHGDTIVQNTQEPAPEYKDLNALKPNTVVNYAISGGKVLNVPPGFADTGSFTVVTMSPKNAINQQSIQILIDKYNRFFHRICWSGNWTAWAMPDKWSVQNKILTPGVLVAPYDNLNTLPVPSTVTYGRGDVLNAPNGVVDYVVTTMSGSGNLSGAMQLLVDKNTGHTYTRVGWGPTSNIYFTSWNQLDKEPETPTPQEESYDSPSLSMFGNFGVIGDSFASGSLKVGDEWGGQTDNTTWGAMIARKWGTNMLHLASSGLSTRSWLAHSMGLAKLNSSDVQDVYYCVLGINDFWSLGLDYIGTIDDVESGADTFFGNYGKIIKAIQTKAPKAKIILFGIADPSAVATSFNVAIEALATHFGIPYVDQKTDGLFTSNYYLNNMVGGHPTAPMYASMALAFERLIKKAVVDNFTYFKDYGL